MKSAKRLGCTDVVSFEELYNSTSLKKVSNIPINMVFQDICLLIGGLFYKENVRIYSQNSGLSKQVIPHYMYSRVYIHA